jgi:endonuclease G
MKKLTLIIIPFFLIAAGCKKDGTGTPTQNNPPTTTKTNPTDTTTTPVNPTQPKSYSLTETFEKGTKDFYAPANVTLSSGVWYFDAALIGRADNDVKNGKASVHTGYPLCNITTMFDINGLNQVSFKYLSQMVPIQVMISTDGGKTFNQVGNDVTARNTDGTFLTAIVKITTNTKVRLKILTKGYGGNLDDVTFEGTGDPGFTLNN